jgi:lycopene beta-cyclase
MTYFAFLAIFVGIPLLILSAITLRDYRRGAWMPPAFTSWLPLKVIVGLCVVALIYTTPWDNYLVATGVWYYNPNLVTGIIIGWVPIEEYTFFVVLPIATGLWTLWLMRNMRINPNAYTWQSGANIRYWSMGVVFVAWVVCCVVLGLSLTQTAWKPFTYLALELSWFLVPIMIQLFFGADILLRHWRIVLTAIVTSTVYLSAADAVAIAEGTWTIDPAQSLPILLGGLLPIEEFIFFGIVNVLVVMGLTLVLARESHERLHELEKIPLLRPLAKRLNTLQPPHTERIGDPV